MLNSYYLEVAEHYHLIAVGAVLGFALGVAAIRYGGEQAERFWLRDVPRNKGRDDD